MAHRYHIKNYMGVAFFIKSGFVKSPFESLSLTLIESFPEKAHIMLEKIQARLGSGTLEKALDKLDVDREYFLKVLMPNEHGYLVSLHNNFRGYNVHKEKI